MRIIAGKMGGRQFQAPPGHKVHPMSEKVRGALFNTLGDIEGMSVLDAFAGSGALAFEAASRGASRVIAIEKDGPVSKLIEQNARDLGLRDYIHVTRANAIGWSDNNPDAKFDIVLLDPPFNDLQPRILNKLSIHVREQGLLVLSWPENADAADYPDFDKILIKNYGDSQLVFYRRK